MSDNPISEVNPLSLAEIMALDPLKLTKQDRAAIVTELRRARASWEIAESKGKRVAPTKEPKKIFSLEDLGEIKL